MVCHQISENSKVLKKDNVTHNSILFKGNYIEHKQWGNCQCVYPPKPPGLTITIIINVQYMYSCISVPIFFPFSLNVCRHVCSFVVLSSFVVFCLFEHYLLFSVCLSMVLGLSLFQLIQTDCLYPCLFVCSKYY